MKSVLLFSILIGLALAAPPGTFWSPCTTTVSIEEASLLKTVVTIRVSAKEFERTIDAVVQLRSSDAASDLIQRSKSIRFSTSQKAKDENKDE